MTSFYKTLTKFGLSSLDSMFQSPAISAKKQNFHENRPCSYRSLVPSPPFPISMVVKPYMWKVKRYQQHCTKRERETCYYYCDVLTYFLSILLLHKIVSPLNLIQCCPKKWKFGKLIQTKIVHIYKTAKTEDEYFSRNILSIIV